MSRRWRVGLIGAGAMGAHHARVIATGSRSTLRVVVDHHPDHAETLARLVSGGRSSERFEALLDCDAVVVATPTGSHHDIVVPLLEHGIAVLVEKPASLRADDVAEMLAAARHAGVALACGFVQRHHPAWLAVRSIASHFGEPARSFSAERRSPPVPRAEGSEVVDLMIHDLDLLDTISPLDRVDIDVAADGGGTVATLEHRNGTANVVADRMALRRVRRVRLESESEWVEADLLRSVVTIGSRDIARSWVVPTEHEPLATQLQWFLGFLDGAVDIAPQLESFDRVHRVTFSVDELRAARRSRSILMYGGQ